MAYLGLQPLYGAYEKQSLTADSTTTTFTLNYTVGSSSSILVSVAGVHQEPEVAYNLASGGTQIIFTAAPTTGDTVFVIFLGVAFTTATLGTGAITSQTEKVTPADNDYILIYDTAGAALKKVQKSNLSPTLTYTTRTATGNGSTATYTVTTGLNVNKVLVTENGVLQVPTTDYTISGTTLTFTTAPASGVSIQIRELP